MPDNDVWTTTQSAETDLPPSVIWSAWSDVRTWPRWNADIERLEIDGPFEVGSVITMTPRGQEPVRLRITEMVPGALFVDEADVGDTRIRTVHRLDRVFGERTRISYELEARGPLATQLGPAISGDFAEVIAALIVFATLIAPDRSS